MEEGARSSQALRPEAPNEVAHPAGAFHTHQEMTSWQGSQSDALMPSTGLALLGGCSGMAAFGVKNHQVVSFRAQPAALPVSKPAPHLLPWRFLFPTKRASGAQPLRRTEVSDSPQCPVTVGHNDTVERAPG